MRPAARSWSSTTSRRSARSCAATCSGRATRRAWPLDGVEAVEMAAAQRARPRGARPHAARASTAWRSMRRIRALGGRRTRDHPAHGARRGVRPRHRPAPGRRRLHRQAVLPGRARGARRRGAAAHRHRRRAASRRCASTASSIDPGGRRVRLDGEEVVAHPARVRAAALPRPPPGPGVHAQPADGPRVAVLVLHRHLDGHRPHPAAAGQARGRPRSARAGSRRYGASATASRREAAGRQPRLRDRRRRRCVAAVALVGYGRRRGAGDAEDPRAAGLRHGRSSRTRWSRARARLGGLRRQFAVVAVVGDGAARGRRRAVRRPDVRLRPRRVLRRRSPRPTPRRWPPGRCTCSGAARSTTSTRCATTLPPSARAAATCAPASAGATSSPAWRPTSTRWSRGSTREERARRDLIAAVSHDLRTPITALRLLADAIDDGVVDAEDRREYAARIGTHVRALGALIDDLFELTRLESGELALDDGAGARSTSSSHEAVEAMRPAADAERGRPCAPSSPRALAAARGNPEQLQRVLFNLIQNAIRHTPPDGSVTVRAERVGDAIEIEVADTGDGDRRRAPRARVRAVLPRRRGAHRRRAPGSASRSRARSSRPTAGRSGSRTRPSARACASACRRAARRRRACNAQAPAGDSAGPFEPWRCAMNPANATPNLAGFRVDDGRLVGLEASAGR